MNKPSDKIIEAVAPSHDIEELPISDGYSLRNVSHAEQRDTLRLPRGGGYEASLVVAKRFYDGSSGGEAGHYALAYVEFRAAGSRWRTVGVKIRAEEATRLARDIIKSKASKPARGEAPRVGGKELPAADSELRGAPIHGGFVIYIRHKNRGGEWARTRGVEIRDIECPVIAATLQTLAAKLKEPAR